MIGLLIYHALIDTERHLSHRLDIWGNTCNIGAVLLWTRKYLEMSVFQNVFRIKVQTSGPEGETRW